MNLTQWVLLLVVLLMSGCYDEKEGCLDPTALNFDVSADKGCCCEYPKLKLKLKYLENDSTSFSKLNYFKDVGGDVYQIASFSFFISHLEVKEVGGDWIDAEDSTAHWVYGAQGTPEDVLMSSNVVLVKSNLLDYDFGDFVDFGSFDSVRFEIGMDELQKTVIPDSLPKGHALAVGDDSMWVSPKVFLQQKWVIVTDTTLANYQLDTFKVSAPNIPITLGYTVPFVVQKGKDYKLELAITVPKWLDSIDWQGDRAQIIDKLGENSVFAISLVQ